MVLTNSSIPGQIGNTGSDTALQLTMFAGEVLKTFREKNIFLGLTRSKDVGAGRSHQFPVLGQAEASRYVRNQNILDESLGYLNNIEGGQRLIQVDRPLIASIMVENWDSLITHFEFRDEYAVQLGEALARGMDKQVAQVIALAARSSATLSATQSLTKAGQVIEAAGVDTSASTMIEAMITAATGFEERDVRSDEIHFVVKPGMFFKLAEEGSLIHKDFNPSNGSRAEGLVMKGYGFKIGMTNNMPSTVVANLAAGELNSYGGDFTKTQALAFHRDAVGTVYRQGVTVSAQDKLEYDGTLTVAKLITGTGILRPECAAEITLPLA